MIKATIRMTIISIGPMPKKLMLGSGDGHPRAGDRYKRYMPDR